MIIAAISKDSLNRLRAAVSASVPCCPSDMMFCVVFSLENKYIHDLRRGFPGLRWNGVKHAGLRSSFVEPIESNSKF